jgi:CheY-like chemotaxis protein
LAQRGRRECEPFRLNGAAHQSGCEGELRIGPSFFKDWNGRNIAQMPHTILYIEDHKLVADAVKDTLEAEGWRVVACVDGAAALSRVASGARYDLLITDNHLPHVDGLELVRYARRLRHRSELPIVMFSAVDCSEAAYSSGVNAFLKKPEGVNELVSTVRRLLNQGA